MGLKYKVITPQDIKVGDMFGIFSSNKYGIFPLYDRDDIVNTRLLDVYVALTIAKSIAHPGGIIIEAELYEHPENSIKLFTLINEEVFYIYNSEESEPKESEPEKQKSKKKTIKG